MSTDHTTGDALADGDGVRGARLAAGLAMVTLVTAVPAGAIAATAAVAV